jgi:transcriptional regulator with XRE-family HTH domain
LTLDENPPGGIQHWRLAEALRQLRERHGLTCDEVGDRLRRATGGRWSRSKVSRIETRAYKPRRYELEAMLDLYGVRDPLERDAMVRLQEGSIQRGYWDPIRPDLPEDFHRVLDIEASLVERRQFETMLIPGLLQTMDFARALITSANPGIPPEQAERRVIARMTRQQVLTRPDPLRLHVILDEAILDRPVGPLGVMRNQLHRLVDAARAEHVTIQILPTAVGASPALNGPFSVMTPPNPMPEFAYVEAPGKAHYTDDDAIVRAFANNFAVLAERALSPARSADRITAAADRYERNGGVE